jgi:hypothetical protein
MSAYERTCTGGYTTALSSVEDSGTIPGLVAGVECNNGDSIGAFSSLLVFSNGSEVTAAMQAFPTDSYGYTCFIVGPDWLMQASSISGVSSAGQDAQAEQRYLGGSIRGACD